MKRLSVTLSLAALAGVCVLSRWLSEHESSLRRLSLAFDEHEARQRAQVAPLIETIRRSNGSLAVLPGERFTSLWPTPEAAQRFVETEPLDSNRHTK